MTKIISPLTLKIMIECFSCSEPGLNILPGTWNSQPALDARIWLEQNGLIGDEYKATKKGTFWLNEMLETPLPEQVYASGRKVSE